MANQKGSERYCMFIKQTFPELEDAAEFRRQEHIAKVRERLAEERTRRQFKGMRVKELP